MVVKSQILAGGRGLGHFTNGLQVCRHSCRGCAGAVRDAAAASGPCARLLGMSRRRQRAPAVAACASLQLGAAACPAQRSSTADRCSSATAGRYSHLQGGVHICKAEEAPGLAAKMLGGTLVTKQVRGVHPPSTLSFRHTCCGRCWVWAAWVDWRVVLLVRRCWGPRWHHTTAAILRLHWKRMHTLSCALPARWCPFFVVAAS